MDHTLHIRTLDFDSETGRRGIIEHIHALEHRTRELEKKVHELADTVGKMEADVQELERP